MHLILEFLCFLLSQLFSFIAQNVFMNQNHLESLLCTNSWVLCPEVLIQFVLVVVQYFLFLTSSLKMLRMTHLFWKCISRTIDLLYCMEYFHTILWTNPFKWWCWRRLTKVPWTAKKSNQSILKEIKPVNPKGNQTLNIHWKDWCWSWISITLVTWWKELTHWKRPWCWEELKAKGEGSDREWDG